MIEKKEGEGQDFHSLNSKEPSINLEIKLLKKNIAICDERKENLKRHLLKLREQYKSGEINYGKYELLSSHYLHGKTPTYWLGYYNDYKTKAELKIIQLGYVSLCREAIIEKPVVEDEITHKTKRIKELESKVLQLEKIIIRDEESKKPKFSIDGKVITATDKYVVIDVAGVGVCVRVFVACVGVSAGMASGSLLPLIVTIGFSRVAVFVAA